MGRVVHLLLCALLTCVAVAVEKPALAGGGSRATHNAVARYLAELRNKETGGIQPLSDRSREELKAILDGGLTNDYSEKVAGAAEEWNFISFLQVAGLTEEVLFRPLLKSIADHYKDRSAMITVYAMHSLWLSGEERRYFLDFVYQWDESNPQSRAAGFILSFKPDEEARLALAHAKENAHVGPAFDAVTAAMRMTSSVAEGLSHSRSIRDKVDSLIESMFQRLRNDSWEAVVWLDQSVEFDWPVEVWARMELRRLARDHPDEVSAALEEIVIPERLPEAVREKYDWFLEYLSRFVRSNIDKE